jgi:uncharacterized protein (DUF433 family)
MGVGQRVCFLRGPPAVRSSVDACHVFEPHLAEELGRAKRSIANLSATGTLGYNANLSRQSVTTWCGGSLHAIVATCDKTTTTTAKWTIHLPVLVLHPFVFILFRRSNAMDWHDRISLDPKVLVGKPVIKGTRIAVEFLMELLANGWMHEQILANYPHLAEDDIQAALHYAAAAVKQEHVYPLPV